jgi:alginate production protein
MTGLKFLLPALFLVTAATLPMPAWSDDRNRVRVDAAEPATIPAERAARDRRRPGEIRLSDSFTLRTLLALDFETERNFSLGRDRDDTVRVIEPLLRLNGTWRPTRGLRGFFELELPVNFERRDRWVTDPSINLNQLYFSYDVTDDLTVRFGRQLFRDDREWLLDEQLDGVRLLYEWSGFNLDLSATRRNSFRRDLRDPGTVGRPTNNFALIATYELFDDFTLGGYVMFRDGRTGRRQDGQPVFLGLRSRGRLWFDGLEHWAEIAAVRGRDERGRRLQGHAVDVGAIYRFAAPMEPRFTLGYAWGSGDRNPRSGTNTAFRQTGLQSNEARRGSLAKFRYYGEVLDPELSNLHIATAGFGFAPFENVTLDFLFHRYWQDRVAGELRNAALDLAPNRDRGNLSRDIGQEIDIILGVRLSENVQMELAGGYFMPGRAFRFRRDGEFRQASGAMFVRLEFDIRF